MSQEKIKNRIDYKTLSEALSIQTKHGDDQAMLSYIQSKLADLDVTVQTDDYGNIYVTKGTAKSYPCVVAHTDTVQSVLADVTIYRNEDTIFAFDPVKRTQHGIGGDDKVGVYITLQLLVDIPIMKAVFFRDEEIGCKGSDYSITNHKEWYEDCGYVLMADRRGNSDAIRVSGGLIIASDDFLDACQSLFEKYGYKETIGIFTDVDTLTAGGIGISTINLSCGYHEPHTSKEVVSFRDVNKCYNLMYDIISEQNGTKFPHECKAYVYKSKHAGPYTKESLFHDLAKYGTQIFSPVKERQKKMFPPLIFGDKVSLYDDFKETDVVGKEGKKKLYIYTGIKSLPITGETKCPKCARPALDNLFYLPYESRMYCTHCNDYVDDTEVNRLFEFLEVEDREDTFVYSNYCSGWLNKKDALWSAKLGSWTTDGLPF